MSHPQRSLIEVAEQVEINEQAIPMMVNVPSALRGLQSFGRSLANSSIGQFLGTSSRMPDRIRDRYDSPEDRQAREDNAIAAQKEKERLEQEGIEKRRNFKADSAESWNDEQLEFKKRLKDQYGADLYKRVKDEMFPDGWIDSYSNEQIAGYRSGERDGFPSVMADGGRGGEWTNNVRQARLDVLDRMNQIRQQERDDEKAARDLELATERNKTNKMRADNARARLEQGDKFYDSPMNTPTGRKSREEDERTVAAYDDAQAATSEVGSELKKGNLGALSFGNMMRLMSSKSKGVPG